MSQTKPHPWRHPPPKPVPWRVYLAGLPRGESQNPRESLAKLRRQREAPKDRGEGGVIAVWYISWTGGKKHAQFRMKVVSDVLLLSHLDKFSLRVTVEAGQALACLYREARLYKGPGLANPSQSTATRSTGNISVWIQKFGHSNTRGIVSFLFFSRSK